MKLVIGKFYKVNASQQAHGCGRVPLDEHITGAYGINLSTQKSRLLQIEGDTAELELSNGCTWWVQSRTLVPYPIKRKTKGLALEKEFLDTLHSRRWEV